MDLLFSNKISRVPFYFDIKIIFLLQDFLPSMEFHKKNIFIKPISFSLATTYKISIDFFSLDT